METLGRKWNRNQKRKFTLTSSDIWCRGRGGCIS